MPWARVIVECFYVCLKDKYIARYFSFIYMQPAGSQTHEK